MRNFVIATVIAAATLSAPASAAVQFFTSSAAYFAALANSNARVGLAFDFEDGSQSGDVNSLPLGFVVNDPSQPFFPTQFNVEDGAGNADNFDAVVSNVYNKFGRQSLQAVRPNGVDFFLAGDSIIYGTGEEQTDAFSVYINIQQSTVDQLYIDYDDPLEMDSQRFTGGSGAYDTGTFYFLGVIADRGNTAWAFGTLETAVSGFNVDNINIQAPAGVVPEPASWAMLIAGFGLTGAMLRRRRAVPA